MDFLFSFTEMKENAVYARAQAAILRSSGYSVKDIAKCWNKPNDGWTSGQKKSLSKANQEVDDRLFWQIVREM